MYIPGTARESGLVLWFVFCLEITYNTDLSSVIGKGNLFALLGRHVFDAKTGVFRAKYRPSPLGLFGLPPGRIDCGTKLLSVYLEGPNTF